MFGEDNFDVVIANPPYLREKDNKDIFDVVNKSEFGKKYHQGKMDYWYYFLHKAIDIAEEEGVICYITSRYWLNSYGASKLIKRVKDDLRFKNVVDIGKLKVFDSVAGQHMIAVYAKETKENSFIYKKLANDIYDVNSQINTDNIQISHLSNKKVFTSNNEINFNYESNFILKDTVLLGEIYDSSVGIQESPDKIKAKMLEGIDQNDISVGDGVFVLSESEYKALNLCEDERRCIKPYLDPNDVFKYRIKQQGKKYIIYSDKIVKKRIAEDPKFKNIKKHLDKYADFITSSNKPYGLHRPREEKYFSNNKIIFKGMFIDNEVMLDEDSTYYFGFSFSSIIQKDTNYSLKYLLGILNSTFALKWFLTNGKKRGAGVDVGVEKLRLFPVKVASKKEQDKIVKMVDRILVKKKKGEDILGEEGHMNQMVCELYGVTEGETAV